MALQLNVELEVDGSNSFRGGEKREVNDFSSVEPFLPGLRLYCRTLASNEWDAEDLLQEVLTKVYRSLRHSPDRELSKAFLRRIAKNAWIDHCRRPQVLNVAYDEAIHQTAYMGPNDLRVRESLEELAAQLNPRQLVLILVMDVFRFNAIETAGLLHMTVGAVKEGLRRARIRLQAGAEPSKESQEWSKPKHTHKSTCESELSREVLEPFLMSFRAGDPVAICRTYLALVAQGIHMEKVTSGPDCYYFYLRDPDGHLIRFFQKL